MSAFRRNWIVRAVSWLMSALFGRSSAPGAESVAAAVGGPAMAAERLASCSGGTALPGSDLPARLAVVAGLNKSARRSAKRTHQVTRASWPVPVRAAAAPKTTRSLCRPRVLRATPRAGAVVVDLARWRQRGAHGGSIKRAA